MGSKLVLHVKQGEIINVGFTIMAGDVPMDLTSYDIVFQVKEVPLESAKPVINKLITTTSDMNTDGVISFPDQGQFTVHLSKEDTSHNTGDYSLIIAVKADNYYDIISSRCCSNAIFRICEQ